MPQNKAFIRKFYRDVRRGITASKREAAALAAAEVFVAHSSYQQCENIACYLAQQEEMETMPLIEAIWRERKNCYLPVLAEGKVLAFTRYEQGAPLRPNQYGILEPENQTRKITAEKLQLVIVPLVAFDKKGHRLGMGGGFYDRTFAFVHSPNAKRPLILGLAYSTQEAENLPTDPWDVQLDGVITEKGIVTRGE